MVAPWRHWTSSTLISSCGRALISASGDSSRLRLDWLAFDPRAEASTVMRPLKAPRPRAGGDAAVLLHGLGGRAAVGDLRQEVDLPLAVGEEEAVEPAGGVRALEHEVEVRAQQAPAEREQVLLVAAARRGAHDPGLDLGGGGAVLVQAQVADGRALAEREFGREVAERRRLAEGDEMLEQRESCAGAGVDDDARLVDRGRAGGRDVHEVDRFRELAAGGDADEHAARGERVGEERVAVVGVVARRAQESSRRLRDRARSGPRGRPPRGPRAGPASRGGAE